eukprot:SAG11_NODE_3_length_39220_cov_67.005828_4_plen_153_part_00
MRGHSRATAAARAEVTAAQSVRAPADGFIVLRGLSQALHSHPAPNHHVQHFWLGRLHFGLGGRLARGSRRHVWRWLRRRRSTTSKRTRGDHASRFFNLLCKLRSRSFVTLPQHNQDEHIKRRICHFHADAGCSSTVGARLLELPRADARGLQ